MLSYTTKLQNQTDAMSSSCTDGVSITFSSKNLLLIALLAFEQHARVKRARTEVAASLGSDVLSEYRHLQQGFVLTSSAVENIAGLTVSEVSSTCLP